jgi:glucose/arabinose dehydrogenase
MKTFIKNLLVIVVGLAVIYGVYGWAKTREEVPVENNNPAPTPPPPPSEAPNTPQPGKNNTSYPLKVPINFTIDVYAKNLSGARVIAFDNVGNMWVTRTSAGKVSIIRNSNGAIASEDIFSGLNDPHGIAFDNDYIYIAEENKISRRKLNTNDPLVKIADLPSGSGHFTRTIKFGPDGRLYVSIGSSCNVCIESDPRRAAIYSIKPDGSDFKQYAKGLRNTVFFTWSYVDGKMWGTDMGRDYLGDNLPPEEINILEDGKNYGWPICYGNNIHDDGFDKNTYVRNPCMAPFETAPKIEMQAHSAPLGLSFIPEEGWPEDYWYDLIVAFHGSWNRSEKTGYKLVRIKLDSKGNYEGTEDFIYGWLQNGNALGRPVDVYTQPGGVIFVSDDKAGVIYKITHNGYKE